MRLLSREVANPLALQARTPDAVPLSQVTEAALASIFRNSAASEDRLKPSVNALTINVPTRKRLGVTVMTCLPLLGDGFGTGGGHFEDSLGVGQPFEVFLECDRLLDRRE